MQDIFPCPEYRVITHTTGTVRNISQVDNAGLSLWQRHVLVGFFSPK